MHPEPLSLKFHVGTLNMNLFRVDCPTAPKMSQSALETESNFINQFDNFAAVYRQVRIYCNVKLANKLGIAKF